MKVFLLAKGMHVIFRKKKFFYAFFFVNLLDLNLIKILVEKLPIKKNTFAIVVTLLKASNTYKKSLSNIPILIRANK